MTYKCFFQISGMIHFKQYLVIDQMNMWDKIYQFFSEGLWQVPYDPKHPFRGALYRFLRITISSISGFSYDDIFSKASALTFYFLLSIVPVLAVAFGIAKGFGFEITLEEEIIERFHEYPEVANRIIQFSYSTLEQAKGGVIAGVGVITLLYTVFKLLNYTESSLNSIFKVPYSRPLSRQISDYLAAMFVMPIFVVIAGSINIYITTKVIQATRTFQVLDVFSPLLFFMLSFIPYLISWILFSFIYIFLPNTQIKWFYGILAGVIAGTAYQFLQWLYINFQVNLSSYGAIYGSFAAIPLFLIWLNWSWIIVLAGAEIAYQAEHDEFERVMGSGQRTKIPLPHFGLLITLECVKAFKRGTPPPRANELAKMTNSRISDVKNVLLKLTHTHILSTVRLQEGDYGYQPAKDVNILTMKEVVDALNLAESSKISVPMTAEVKKMEEALENLNQTSLNNHANDSLSDLQALVKNS